MTKMNLRVEDEEQDQNVFIDEDDVMRVQYRPLDEQEKAKMLRMKTAGQAMLSILNSFGNSAEFTIARTKVAEAVMWAINGLTR